MKKKITKLVLAAILLAVARIFIQFGLNIGEIGLPFAILGWVAGISSMLLFIDNIAFIRKPFVKLFTKILEDV